LNCYFWQDETHKNDILALVAHLVLPDDGAAYFSHVSFLAVVNPERKMVSVLFYDGAHLGQKYFIYQWFLLTSYPRAKIRQAIKLYVCGQSHLDD
jgi:hypothetical protein